MLFPCIVQIYANTWYSCSELYCSSAPFPIKMSKLNFPARVCGSVTKAKRVLLSARWRGECVSCSSWTRAEPPSYGPRAGTSVSSPRRPGSCWRETACQDTIPRYFCWCLGRSLAWPQHFQILESLHKSTDVVTWSTHTSHCDFSFIWMLCLPERWNNEEIIFNTTHNS